jgi:hypothetical protein
MRGAPHPQALPVIEAVRGAVHLFGVGRMIAYRRVMMNETLTGFSLHDTHGPPIDETISYTPYGALGARYELTPPTLRGACWMLIEVSQWAERTITRGGAR